MKHPFACWKRVLAFASCAAGLLATATPSEAVTFSVSGSKILKDGSEFVIKGVNVNGPNWVWARGTAQDADMIVNKWKFNTVRVNCYIGTTRTTENGDLAALVKAFTDRGAVVQLEPHDFTGKYATSTSSPTLNTLKDWWVARANEFKNNPYVWFNIANEPGNGDGLKQDWLTMHDTTIGAIRATGANNIIVCDENDWATVSANKKTIINSADSAILTYGPTLKSKYSNIAYAIHVYHQFNAGGTGIFSDFITRVQNAGFSVHIGEWGQSAFDPWESVTATTNMFKVIRSKKVGRIAWHWYPGDANKLTTETNSYTPGGGWAIDKTDGTRPTNLSWIGELAWDDNRDQTLIIDNVPTPLSKTGWTATASNVSSDTTPANLVDNDYKGWGEGNYSSGTGIKDGLWIQIDMQSAKSVSRVDVRAQYGTFTPHGYKIYVSNNSTPSSADLVATVLNKQSEKRATFTARSGRYVRIETTGGLTWGGWWGVTEVQVYGTSTTTPPTVTNLVSNPGFEAEQFNTQTPSGWSEAQYDANWNSITPQASFTESNGGSASGNFHGTHWVSYDYRVYTYQTKTGLANGLYTLRCKARSGGGQNKVQLEAKDHGDNGSKQTAAIPVSSTYQLVEIKNINVTNGQCTIGVWSDSPANKWVYFDDFELFKQ